MPAISHESMRAFVEIITLVRASGPPGPSNRIRSHLLREAREIALSIGQDLSFFAADLGEDEANSGSPAGGSGGGHDGGRGGV